MVYVADSHALIWWLLKDTQLGAAALAALQDPASEIVIPTIVLAEIAFLNSRGRIAIDLARTLAFVVGSTNCKVHPLDEEVVQMMPNIFKIHDRIIVATAILFRDKFSKSTTL